MNSIRLRNCRDVYLTLVELTLCYHLFLHPLCFESCTNDRTGKLTLALSISRYHTKADQEASQVYPMSTIVTNTYMPSFQIRLPRSPCIYGMICSQVSLQNQQRGLFKNSHSIMGDRSTSVHYVSSFGDCTELS